MPDKLPTLFVSHGAPDLILHALPAREFLASLGASLAARFKRPRAIVVASAHYDEGLWPCVTAAAQPRTIHDFSGFDRRLYEMHYGAPGAPEFAARIVAALTTAGMAARLDENWGFDHGTWVPLMLMYPAADIPVVAISIHLGANPEYHLRLGRALACLPADDVLVIGSGAFTHNLRETTPPADNSNAPAWVQDFADWTGERLLAGDEATLLDYREKAPHAHENHPTDEHFTPLFVAMGAAGSGWRAERLHSSVTYGSVRMDMFAFH